MKTRYLFYSMIIALVFLSGCVQPSKFVALENRVAAMEMEYGRQTEKLKQYEQNQLEIKKFFKDLQKKSIGREEYAELKYNIKTMKEDLQKAEGLTQEVRHNISQYIQKDEKTLDLKLEQLDQAISNNYKKIIKLEKYMGFEPSAADQTQAEKKRESSEKPGQDAEQKLYDLAKKLFDDGDKKNARIQFENFINKYPDSDNTDNARFWIADSYYSEKWFEKAILEYQKVLENYPDSNKLAAARLKQGYAFAKLGEKANARLILKELLKKHPDSKEAEYARKKLKSLQ